MPHPAEGDVEISKTEGVSAIASRGRARSASHRVRTVLRRGGQGSTAFQDAFRPPDPSSAAADFRLRLYRRRPQTGGQREGPLRHAPALLEQPVLPGLGALLGRAGASSSPTLVLARISFSISATGGSLAKPIALRAWELLVLLYRSRPSAGYSARQPRHAPSSHRPIRPASPCP